MLNWAGKSAAYQTLQTPTFKTLMPCIEDSVDFEHTQNVFIEGENLNVLKVLQKSYFNSVKMIYIDPPYNTGNDFIYKDNFAESKAEYAERVGDLDADGKLKRAFVRNSKENGHYHSNWLNMMLPRLHLAKNLLTNDGVIFISIDDNEQAQLKLLCDEVFGEENFVDTLIWKKLYGGKNDAKWFAHYHDYVLVYAKDKLNWYPNLLERDSLQIDRYKNPDNDPRGAWTSADFSQFGPTPNCVYEIETPNGTKYYPTEGKRWITTYDKYLQLRDENRLWFGKDGGSMPRQKRYLSEVKQGVSQSTFLDYEEVGHSDEANKELKSLFEGKYFDYPKPIRLLKRLIHLGTNVGDLILDFFSGSGSTAHAVMQLNAEDNGNRRFICVQLPEQTDEKSEAFKAGFKNIAEISKERIRRAGKQILQNNAENQPLDVGFKVFKLTESHFKQWQSPTAENLADQLEMFIDPVSEQTDTQAVLYEILLRLGLKLTVKVRSENQVFWVEDENGQTFALMLTEINDKMIEKVIAKQPKKVVTLDRLFNGNDAHKKNTELQMHDADIAFFVI
ncbi:site-specific DNA-methyltransferase [uncultured Actinobacillus sp.]|uniref:site-specific DNA-methyltransferase n=1 Tax=uncultured Actinobacillus sp. TaxID=417616 RepID=UPI0025ECEEAD|nr:site-specific DNA-methyltransferase [uncultured Actinobacillus sp.]